MMMTITAPKWVKNTGKTLALGVALTQLQLPSFAKSAEITGVRAVAAASHATNTELAQINATCYQKVANKDIFVKINNTEIIPTAEKRSIELANEAKEACDQQLKDIETTGFLAVTPIGEPPANILNNPKALKVGGVLGATAAAEAVAEVVTQPQPTTQPANNVNPTAAVPVALPPPAEPNMFNNTKPTSTATKTTKAKANSGTGGEKPKAKTPVRSVKNPTKTNRTNPKPTTVPTLKGYSQFTDGGKQLVASTNHTEPVLACFVPKTHYSKTQELISATPIPDPFSGVPPKQLNKYAEDIAKFRKDCERNKHFTLGNSKYLRLDNGKGVHALPLQIPNTADDIGLLKRQGESPFNIISSNAPSRAKIKTQK
jgi:hypothetical protein